ncbi:MAG: hypothetical protein IT169_10615 [Bryobacterales bacterium]|nr:hypothetical protein [Bryobacterales bacterium]
MQPRWALVCLLAIAPSFALAESGQTAGNASAPLPAAHSPARSIRDYVPITGNERLQWYLRSTGSAAVSSSILSAAWSTAWRSPCEYPETWGGFGKRYGLAISGVAMGNGIEVGLGAMWGEDPRYHRVGGPLRGNLKARVGHVLLSSVTATNRQGERMPAYSRFIAIPSSNFMQNAWRVGSQSSVNDALLRTLYGFLGRMGGNAFNEFWPDFRRRNAHPPSTP